MRCMVTGATGLVGSFLLRKLLREGAEVGVLVWEPRELRRIEDLVPCVTLLSDRESVRAFAPDVVFHLAWSGVTRDTRDLPAQIHVNVPYALDVFRLAADAGARTWIGLGSQAEYGETSELLRETTVARPVEAYGVAKLAVAALTEKLCRLAAMRYVWIRLVAAYGPADDHRRLIPMLIRTLASGESPSLTSGEQFVDYLYVEDVADALWAAAVNDGVDGVFNLASGNAVRVRELAELVRDLIAPEVQLGFAPSNGSSNGSARDLRADVSRFRAAARWEPRTTLREGVEKTIRWYRESAP